MHQVSIASYACCLCFAAVRAVTKLGVLDVPGLSLDTPTPVSTLAQHTQSNEEYLYRLLRYVSQFGLLVEEPGQQFRLTSVGQMLQADNPSGMCYLAVSAGDPGQYPPQKPPAQKNQQYGKYSDSPAVKVSTSTNLPQTPYMPWEVKPKGTLGPKWLVLDPNPLCCAISPQILQEKPAQLDTPSHMPAQSGWHDKCLLPCTLVPQAGCAGQGLAATS
jgi:hypothetical protein